MDGNLTAETGSMGAASTTTHSRFLPTCGDAPKMPTNSGAFPMRPSSLPVSGRVDGRFRTSVSAAKNPVPGAEKVWWRELRLEAVAAGSVLRLKLGNMKTGIRAGPDQAAQTAATIRPAHHASWRCRCRAEAALRLQP